MDKAILTFSNGETLTLKYGDVLNPYGASMHDPGPDATVWPWKAGNSRGSPSRWIVSTNHYGSDSV